MKYKGTNFNLSFFFFICKNRKTPVCSISMLESTVVRIFLQVLNQIIVVNMNVLFEQKSPMDMTVLEKIFCQRN